MPSFKIHEKWAEKLGISPLIAREVNKYIDLGEIHDWHKYRQLVNSGLSNLYEAYGREGVRATFLHAMLDFLSDKLLLREDVELSVPIFSVNKYFYEDFNIVSRFVKENFNEIREDVRNDPKFQKRLKNVIDFSEFSHQNFDISGSLKFEGRPLPITAALQKVRSCINKGGKCKVTLCREEKKFNLTTVEELDDFLKRYFKGKKIHGNMAVADNQVSIVV